MTQHFNKIQLKSRRRKLRQDQTNCEKLVWTYLRNRSTLGIKFRRQYSVDSFVLDFYSPQLKLAIEIDGDVHNSTEQQKYDAYRQEYIERFGIKFLRIKNEELLTDTEKVFKKIEGTISNLTSKPSKDNS